MCCGLDNRLLPGVPLSGSHSFQLVCSKLFSCHNGGNPTEKCTRQTVIEEIARDEQNKNSVTMLGRFAEALRRAALRLLEGRCWSELKLKLKLFELSAKSR